MNESRTDTYNCSSYTQIQVVLTGFTRENVRPKSLSAVSAPHLCLPERGSCTLTAVDGGGVATNIHQHAVLLMPSGTVRHLKGRGITPSILGFIQKFKRKSCLTPVGDIYIHIYFQGQKIPSGVIQTNVHEHEIHRIDISDDNSGIIVEWLYMDL